MQLIFIIFISLGLLYWLIQLIVLIRIIIRVPMLKNLGQGSMEQWPRVSVIMTACNEEQSLADAMAARLSEDYPDVEFILVDDRSTDATAAIADKLALADPRVKVIHIRLVPNGWLGKLNALNEGVNASSGEWLLISDADVEVRKGVLKRAVSYCIARNLDHLAVLPEVYSVNPLLDCLTSVFLRLVVLSMRIWAIEDSGSKTAIGIGAFNFVNRRALERMGGFETLKMEVADDIALGQLIKAAGGRQSVLNGRELTGLYFHRSIGDAIRSAERASYTAVGNFSLVRIIAVAAFMLLFELSPFIALLPCGVPFQYWATGAMLLMAATTTIALNLWLGRGLLHLVLFPVVQFIICYSNLRAGILGKRRRGIIWKGTFYGEKMLREGKKVRM
jgi:glycosyltransferase involved in cell wall biosynthesis